MKEARKLVDDKKAAKSREKREAEEKRVNDIKGRIQAMREMGDVAMDATVADLTAKLNDAKEWPIVKDFYGEFTPGAQMEKDGVIEKLGGRIVARKKYDEDQADLAKQREEQDRVAKEQEETARKQREEQEAIDKRKRDASTAEQKVKDDESARLRKEENARVAAKAKADAEALEAAQAPDREKIEKYLNDLVSMPVPTLSDPAMVKVMVKISVNLTAFREQAIASVEVA